MHQSKQSGHLLMRPHCPCTSTQDTSIGLEKCEMSPPEAFFDCLVQSIEWCCSSAANPAKCRDDNDLTLRKTNISLQLVYGVNYYNDLFGCCKTAFWADMCWVFILIGLAYLVGEDAPLATISFVFFWWFFCKLHLLGKPAALKQHFNRNKQRWSSRWSKTGDFI